MASCEKCLYNVVCELWRKAECQDAETVLTGGLADCPIYKPTADVVEVKHGEWKHECLKCSVCKRNISEIYDADSYMAYGIEDDLKYCPYCGAKMDGGKAE